MRVRVHAWCKNEAEILPWFSEHRDLALLQFKCLSHDYLIRRSRLCDARVSESDRKLGRSMHYGLHAKISEDEYRGRVAQAVLVPGLQGC